MARSALPSALAALALAATLPSVLAPHRLREVLVAAFRSQLAMATVVAEMSRSVVARALKMSAVPSRFKVVVALLGRAALSSWPPLMRRQVPPARLRLQVAIRRLDTRGQLRCQQARPQLVLQVICHCAPAPARSLAAMYH